VFPVRYELNPYILFRRYSVFEGLIMLNAFLAAFTYRPSIYVSGQQINIINIRNISDLIKIPCDFVEPFNSVF
jgi:hypothetical protein